MLFGTVCSSTGSFQFYITSSQQKAELMCASAWPTYCVALLATVTRKCLLPEHREGTINLITDTKLETCVATCGVQMSVVGGL